VPDVSEIPKWWRDAIAIPYPGPWQGDLARPCMCGYPTDLDGDRTIYLITWVDGTFMFAHGDCVGEDNAEVQ
jgi:hypothetical protein